MRKTIVGLLLLVLLPALACGAGNEADGARTPATSDMAGRTGEVTKEMLPAMVLPQAELGEAFQDFAPSEKNGFETNEQEGSTSIDVKDERSDMERFGRVMGYAASYWASKPVHSGDGPYAVGSEVTLYRDAAGASGNIADENLDMRKRIGKSQENGVTYDAVESFDVPVIGDESFGAYIDITTPNANGAEGFTARVTIIGIRRSNVVGIAYVYLLDDWDMRAAVEALTRKLDARIAAGLAEAATAS